MIHYNYLDRLPIDTPPPAHRGHWSRRVAVTGQVARGTNALRPAIALKIAALSLLQAFADTAADRAACRK